MRVELCGVLVDVNGCVVPNTFRQTGMDWPAGVGHPQITMRLRCETSTTMEDCGPRATEAAPFFGEARRCDVQGDAGGGDLLPAGTGRPRGDACQRGVLGDLAGQGAPLVGAGTCSGAVTTGELTHSCSGASLSSVHDGGSCFEGTRAPASSAATMHEGVQAAQEVCGAVLTGFRCLEGYLMDTPIDLDTPPC